MKKFLCLFLALLMVLPLLAACNGDTPDEGGEQNPPAENPYDKSTYKPETVAKIIYDTDMDCDCDDVGALSLLLEYAKLGWVEVLGVVADVPSKYAAPCCDAICQYYGFNLPIGTVYDAQTNPERWQKYRGLQAGQTNREKDYNRIMAQRVNKIDTDYPSAARVYREILAAAEDKSVTVVAVGLLTALEELFLTGPDEISPLTGVELFEKKVIKVVSMGHAEADFQTSGSANYIMDAIAAQTFFTLCPVPVYVSGGGGSVLVGETYSDDLDNQHPLRRCYEIYLGGKNKARPSWDLVAVLYAMDPSRFRAQTRGVIDYEATSYNTDVLKWREHKESDGERFDYDVVPKISNASLETILEKLTKGIVPDMENK